MTTGQTLNLVLLAPKCEEEPNRVEVEGQAFLIRGVELIFTEGHSDSIFLLPIPIPMPGN